MVFLNINKMIKAQHQNSQISREGWLGPHGKGQCDLHLNTVLESTHRLGRDMQRKKPQERMTS